MTPWTKAKIEKAYANGRRDFSGEDFGGLDLNGIDLTNANLSAANLTMADFTGADLTYANLTGANLTGADLRRANLTSTNIDYSCWPLSCGSIGVKVDKKIAVQLMYHACALDCDDPEYREARAKVLDFANQMHRTDVKRLE